MTENLRSASQVLTEQPRPVWLTLKQAAQRAQLSEATLRREAKAGRLKAVKVAGRRTWRFRPEWVDEWLERSQQVGLR